MTDMPAAAASRPDTKPRGAHVSLRNIRREYDESGLILDDITLDVPTGQFISILGSSGSGKSTLLRLIAGLDLPQGGSISVDGLNREEPGGISYVFQDAHLLPWRTVLSNVTLPLELTGESSRQRRDVANFLIEMVGLKEAIHLFPAQLSGGMRMRVSLARALVTQPSLLLLDEPFAALDEITRLRLDEQLRHLWLRNRMTVIFVTHAISEAVFLAERAVVLSRRPARVILDRAIALPERREQEIRTHVEFAEHVQSLYEALRPEEA